MQLLATYLGWWLLLSVVEATSVRLAPEKLRRLSVVEDLRYDVLSLVEPMTLEFSIAQAPHLSNLERRWYVMADPNARSELDKNLVLDPSLGDSSALYSYLTQNSSSIEAPASHLDFKLILYPQEDYVAPKVNGIVEANMMPTDGIALRKVETSSGSVSWKKVGWARVVVHNDTETLRFHGKFLVDDERGLGFPQTIYSIGSAEILRGKSGMSQDEIEKLIGPVRPEDLVLWRDFDLKESTKSSPLSGLDAIDLDDYSLLHDMTSSHFFKRDIDDTGNGSSSGVNLYETIGDTAGCPTKRQVAMIGVLADCNYLQNFGNMSSVHSSIIEMISSASRMYETAFNITLGLKEVIVADNSSCPSTGSDDQPWNYQCSPGDSALGDRLGILTSWRESRPYDNIASWVLMTKCDSGSVVGLSWLGTVCEARANIAGANVVTTTSMDYIVVAHEIGHSFGAVHDCTTDACSQSLDQTSQCCPGSADSCQLTGNQIYVMNPASVEGITAFSECSQGNVCRAIGEKRVNSTCLQSNSGGLNLTTTNICGNGIVEEGEDCDCGGPEGCGDNPCCDPTTCKFKDNAVCDDSNDECCNSCQFASSETVCRESTGPCDHTEYCPGNSTKCPSDVFQEDGQSCSIDGYNGTESLQCMSGHCSSRDLQCRVLMGNYTTESAGTVRACDDDSSCQLTCMDPRYGTNTCFRSNQNFIDGTPCRGSGSCRNGRCIGGRSSGSSGSPGSGGSGGDDDDFSSGPVRWWRWIVIGVCCAIGVLFLIWFLRKIVVACRTPRKGYATQSPPMQRPTQQPPVYPPPGPAPAYNDPNFSRVLQAPPYSGQYAPPPLPPRAYGGQGFADGPPSSRW